jgi:hypothetical protein
MIIIWVGIGYVGTHPAIFLIHYSIDDQLVMEGRDFMVVVGNLTVWLLYSRGYNFQYDLIRFGIHPFLALDFIVVFICETFAAFEGVTGLVVHVKRAAAFFTVFM